MIFTLLLMKLILFHIYLQIKGLTTYQYIKGINHPPFLKKQVQEAPQELESSHRENRVASIVSPRNEENEAKSMSRLTSVRVTNLEDSMIQNLIKEHNQNNLQNIATPEFGKDYSPKRRQVKRKSEHLISSGIEDTRLKRKLSHFSNGLNLQIKDDASKKNDLILDSSKENREVGGKDIGNQDRKGSSYDILDIPIKMKITQ